MQAQRSTKPADPLLLEPSGLARGKEREPFRVVEFQRVPWHGPRWHMLMCPSLATSGEDHQIGIAERKSRKPARAHAEGDEAE